MPAPLTIVTMNTRGVPLVGSRLAERYAAIGTEFDAAAVDVLCFQEVLTYVHLALLRRHLPGYQQVVLRPSLAGPAGGLAIFSRLPLARTAYSRFPRHSDGLPLRSRIGALHSGALVTHLAGTGVRVINTHPTANRDGDWSAGNRFHPLQHDQLRALARTVVAETTPTVVCGDFNAARDSALDRDFRHDTGLRDAFGGDCPPTFHAEYLGPGQAPHCIDFVLVSDAVTVDGTALLFASERALPGGPAYVSDHIGLLARLSA